jgi:hypothetical protein
MQPLNVCLRTVHILKFKYISESVTIFLRLYHERRYNKVNFSLLLEKINHGFCPDLKVKCTGLFQSTKALIVATRPTVVLNVLNILQRTNPDRLLKVTKLNLLNQE